MSDVYVPIPATHGLIGCNVCHEAAWAWEIMMDTRDRLFLCPECRKARDHGEV